MPEKPVTMCPAALVLAGEAFLCNIVGEHPGWPHKNAAVQAVWVGGDFDKRLHGPEWRTAVKVDVHVEADVTAAITAMKARLEGGQ